MVDDRRRPDHQKPDADGRRQSDPRLTTRECADRLGVHTSFVVGEIRDGRLEALVIERASRRAVYRISEAALRAYLTRHRWRVPATEK
jgi:excisionase family DNA binding protein